MVALCGRDMVGDGNEFGVCNGLGGGRDCVGVGRADGVGDGLGVGDGAGVFASAMIVCALSARIDPVTSMVILWE